MSHLGLTNMRELLSRFRYADAKKTPNTNEVRIVESLDGEIFEDLYCSISANELENIKKYQMFENSFSRIINHYDENAKLDSFFQYKLDEVIEFKNTKKH